jgi:membrane protein
MTLKDVWDVIKSATSASLTDRVPRMGAALAFYTAFSLSPLLVIVVAVAGLIFGPDAARGQIAEQVSGMVGEQGGKFVQDILANASNEPGSGVGAMLISFALLLFTASGVFVELQDALNNVWGVAPKPNRGLWGIVRDRLLSFGMVLVVGFLLLVSLVVSAGLSALSRLAGLGDVGLTAGTVNFVVSCVVVTVLFALIYKVLPDAKIAWSDVWVGAALTSVLFTLGKALIGLYLGRATIGSAYGAAGSLAVLLLWVYYSGQILLFGAELTRAYADRFGRRIRPAENAVAVTQEARQRQGTELVPDPAPSTVH